MGSNLIMLPIILLKLSEEAIALYYIFTSISAIAVLLDFGFSPSIARSMAYAWTGAKELKKDGIDKVTSAEPNYCLICKIISTCKIIYLALSLVALIASMSIGTIYIIKILNENNSIEYMISWSIYIVAIFFTILFSYYSVFLRGVGAVAEVNKATIIARIAQIILCYILLLFNAGLIGVSLAYLVYGFLFRIIAKYMFYRYKGIGKSIVKYSHELRNNKIADVKEILRIMWPNTWRDGLVTVSNYVLNQATTIICSLYFSLYETGVYSLTVQLTSAIAQIAGTMYTTYQPALQSAYANRDKDSQKQYMSLIITTFIFIFIFGMASLLLFGIPVIGLIKPAYQLPISLVLGVGLYQFVLKYRNCYTSFISTTNRLIYTFSFVISAIICVLLSVLFCGVLKYGLIGLVFAQLISQLLYNAWRWPLLVHSELNYSIFETIPLALSSLKKLKRKKDISKD